jgi:hypothetical protein
VSVVTRKRPPWAPRYVVRVVRAKHIYWRDAAESRWDADFGGPALTRPVLRRLFRWEAIAHGKSNVHSALAHPPTPDS